MTVVVVLLLAIVTVVIVALVLAAALAHSRRLAVEAVFDDARAADAWPSEDDLLEAFAADIENASEADLRRISDRMSTLRVRIGAMARTTPEEKHDAR